MNTLVAIPLVLLCAVVLISTTRRPMAGMRGRVRRLVATSLIVAPGLVLVLAACAGKGK